MPVRTSGFIKTLRFGKPSVASVDLSWSGKYRLPRNDVHQPMSTWVKDLEFWQPEMTAGTVLVIEPGQIAMLTSNETVHVPKDHGAILMSKSTLGRHGLLHVHTGWFDPGFGGLATWEVFNGMPFKLAIQRGQYMVQLVFIDTDTETEGYSGQYYGNKVT